MSIPRLSIIPGIVCLLLMACSGTKRASEESNDAQWLIPIESTRSLDSLCSAFSYPDTSWEGKVFDPRITMAPCAGVLPSDLPVPFDLGDSFVLELADTSVVSVILTDAFGRSAACRHFLAPGPGPTFSPQVRKMFPQANDIYRFNVVSDGTLLLSCPLH